MPFIFPDFVEQNTTKWNISNFLFILMLDERSIENTTNNNNKPLL